MSSFYKQAIGLGIFVTLVPILFVPTFAGSNIVATNSTVQETAASSSKEPSYSVEISNSRFTWPTPGYTRINSPFGRRSSPTRFASSFHMGIDIGAPAGSHLVAVSDSVVTHTGWQRFWRFQHYLKGRKSTIYLPSCQSSLYYFSRATCCLWASDWQGWSQECIWCCWQSL